MGRNHDDREPSRRRAFRFRTPEAGTGGGASNNTGRAPDDQGDRAECDRDQLPKPTAAVQERYALDGADVAGIGTFATYASLYFYRGRELEDASGLLEGGGKDMRFIRLRSPADAEAVATKRIVRKAFTLG